jgi:hypothetical protein
VDRRRRTFLKTAGMAAAGWNLYSWQSSIAAEPPPVVDKSPEAAAKDTQFWSQVASQYDVDRSVTNLENAY